MDTANRPLVIMFVRWPEAGQAKTRLIPAMGEEGAADFYRVMALEQVARLRPGVQRGDYRLLFYVTPVEKLGQTVLFLNGRETPLIDGFPQPEGCLGQRIGHALHWGFQRLAAPSVVLIGSDCPAIDSAVVSRACRLLQGNDAVIGPAADGGYYLLGLRREYPGALEEISYSHRDTARQTIEELRHAGANVDDHSLPTLSDVDTPEDLDNFDPPTLERLRDRALLSGIFVPWLENR